MNQTQKFQQTNKKGFQKIFNIDIHLLYYLRDTAKAYEALQKQLTAIGCSVELDFDQEEAVVTENIDSETDFGAAEKKLVDLVFSSLTESYICHHVLVSEQVRFLQHNLSFETDDIKVYREDNCFVVVGLVEDVIEKITILENIVLTRKEMPILEKKFKVIEEEFTREMNASYPDVKILIGNAMIILEGPSKAVQLGATRLDPLKNKIKERRVTLHTDLISFIKSSDVISKYQSRFQQSLRNPVSLEVGPDLVLFSLSSDALDEAEAAIIRDLRVDTVQLQGAAAVPPDLDRVKEILTKAKNNANSRELRVETSFIPGTSGTAVTKVQLVGYSENVNKLKEVLHDYQTQQVMDLSPELVDCFDKILDLIGVKKTKVTFKASHAPHPRVLVSGSYRLALKAHETLRISLASLISDTLVLDGAGAQRFFQAEGKTNMELVESACKVVITPSPNVSFTPRAVDITASHTEAKLDVKVGSLEDAQVNVLVVPMLNKNVASTKTGTCLLSKAGNIIRRNFDLAAMRCVISPGDVLQVDAPPSLGCSKLFFVECLPWDGVRGQSAQALGKGLKRCLDLCAQQGWCSVAFPVIGPGIILKYPLKKAIQVLTDSICQFGLSGSSGSLSTIDIVIKPDYSDSEECYHHVYRSLSLNLNQGGQVIFKSLSGDLDEVTITLKNGVELQVVFGDITSETTDAVVNTTDFTDFVTDGVCKDILTKAGPQVAAVLKTASLNQGAVVRTPPGSLPCKTILHVCGEQDAGVIEQRVCRVIQDCESSQYKSVAIPAICAGVGGLEPDVVARAILRGIKTTSSSPLRFLTNIRLVLNKINVFSTFKHQTTQMFPSGAFCRVPVIQVPQAPQQQFSDPSIIHTCSTSQQLQSIFLFVGLLKKNVQDAKSKVKDLYLAQCFTQTFTKEQLEGLTQDDMTNLRQMVQAEGLYMQRGQSGRGSLTVSGLKHGVKQVMQMVRTIGPLRREMRAKEEDDLYIRVAWCILGSSGKWERLPKTANYKLEKPDVTGGIVDAQGRSWSVDLKRMEAKRYKIGLTAKLKRLKNLPDLTLPLYWDNMAPGENLKVVELNPSSTEYETVEEAFRRTVTQTVTKIERLQNVHLLCAYNVRKKQICDKNKLQGGASERSLYHGTTLNNCDSIMKTGFDRRFAGQNATAYGHGTYFAVDASYSSNPTYSKPAADGSQLMFVARVLTGTFTVGRSDMKVPPPRNDRQPDDRYDSLVDKLNKPSMYVVFHDNQAYPDYLITFK